MFIYKTKTFAAKTKWKIEFYKIENLKSFFGNKTV